MTETRVVLLVEDDAVQREVLALLLAAEGWEVRAAEDGEAALGVLQELAQRPALVLCDLQMPGLSGTALAGQLRRGLERFGEAGRTAVVAMSATAGVEVTAGFDGLVRKPVEVASLEGWVAGEEGGSLPGFEGSSGGVRELPVVGAEVPVVDLEVVARLRESMPAKSLEGLFAMALSDAEERVRRMGRAYAAGKDAEFRREAHTLKGSAGMIGARRLREMAGLAEAGGIAGVTFSITVGATKVVSGDALVTHFFAQFEALRHMLEGLTADTGRTPATGA